MLALVRLAFARQRGDLESVLHEVAPLLEPVEADSMTDLTLGNDARAVALMNLGIVELWSFELDDAKRHLEQGLALARLIDRPYVQIGCLAHLGLDAARHSLALARQRCGEALGIAEAHGWATDPIVSLAMTTMASTDAAQGRFDEGRRWLERAEHAMRAELDPATALFGHFVRGELLVGEGRFEDALGEFRAAERLQDVLSSVHALTGPARVSIAQTQLRMGDLTAAQETLSRLTERDHEFGEARTAAAALRLAEGDRGAAVDALAPVLDGGTPVVRLGTVIQALLLDAVARDQLGDHVTAERDIERALDLAEPDSLLFPFVSIPVRDLLERHPRHRTAHATLLADLVTVLGGSSLPARRGEPAMPPEPLSASELRVLRFLPSNLSAGEIAGQLFVSTSTVKTHMRHIYEKLDAHRRTEAVDRARELGLLGRSSRPDR
jgi:LuxR family maltose regulon positive regulatory protein